MASIECQRQISPAFNYISITIGRAFSVSQMRNDNAYRKPASRRACLTQFRNVSGDPIPNSLATSTIGRSCSITFPIALDATPVNTSKHVP